MERRRKSKNQHSVPPAVEMRHKGTGKAKEGRRRVGKEEQTSKEGQGTPLGQSARMIPGELRTVVQRLSRGMAWGGGARGAHRDNGSGGGRAGLRRGGCRRSGGARTRRGHSQRGVAAASQGHGCLARSPVLGVRIQRADAGTSTAARVWNERGTAAGEGRGQEPPKTIIISAQT